MAENHRETLNVIGRLTRGDWQSYIVGGTLRDLLMDCPVRGSRAKSVFPRDIDLVVAGASHAELLQTFSDLLDRPTRFGGLHLVKCLRSGYRVLFDVWALEDTWALRESRARANIEDFPRTTFLNVDSGAMAICNARGKKRQVFEHGLLAGIAGRVLDVNYAPNPYPLVCVVRAVIMVAKFGFSMTRQLAEFIVTHASNGSIEALSEAQRSHYGFERCVIRYSWRRGSVRQSPSYLLVVLRLGFWFRALSNTGSGMITLLEQRGRAK